MEYKSALILEELNLDNLNTVESLMIIGLLIQSIIKKNQKSPEKVAFYMDIYNKLIENGV